MIEGLGSSFFEVLSPPPFLGIVSAILFLRSTRRSLSLKSAGAACFLQSVLGLGFSRRN